VDYLAWEARSDGGIATFESLQNVVDSYEISEGVSRAATFPPDVKLPMNRKFPKDIKLPDNCSTHEQLIVVSEPVRAWLAAKNPPEVEILPITLVNHKGRDVEQPYFIVSPLKQVDCIDKANSNLIWNPIDKTLIASIFKLVLDPQQIDESLPMFRLKHKPRIVLIRRDWAEDALKQRFSGMDFVAIEKIRR
jgi:hypothetical protein